MVIVVDGPVNADLQSVIQSYKAKYPGVLCVYQLDSNKGLGEALKFGLTKCSYNYVARADSDDICMPERFQVQKEYFKRKPQLDILGSFIEEFIEDHNIPLNVKQMPLSHEAICKMAKLRNPINHMTVMFKKDKIIDCGSYRHLPYLEDYYLWVRAIFKGCNLENVNKCLVRARVGNGMVKRRGNKQYLKSWKTLNRFMLRNGMISRLVYSRSIISIYVFIFMPLCLKELAYKYILRNRC